MSTAPVHSAREPSTTAALSRFQLVSACGNVAVTREFSISNRHGAEDLLRLAVGEAAIERATAARLDPAEMAARHRAQVMRKYRLRLALDTRRRRQLVEVARHVFATPGAVWYVARETMKTKWPW